MTSPNFAHLLRRQRLWRGWTQQELAERAGLSTRAISDLERGINEAPRLVTVRLLIQALGLADEEATALRTAALNRGTIFVGEARSGLAESSHSNLQVEEVATQHHEFGAAPPTRGEFQFEIHYARRTDGVNTAYGFVGRGPVLLLAPGLLSHLDWWQKAPRNRVFLQLLSEHRTVAVYDRHGCGLSDRDRNDFSPEDDMRDIEAVAQAIAADGSLDLLGDSWGARPTAVFAARHPERVRHLVLYGASVPGRVSELFLERRAAMAALRRTDFDLFARATVMTLFPNGVDDETLRILVDMMRLAATPEMQERLETVLFDLDPILGAIRAPTLVLHRRDDRAAPFAHGQKLASQIPNARFIPLEGSIHPVWAGDSDTVVKCILDFLVEGQAAGAV